jgi:hypothetical protein
VEGWTGSAGSAADQAEAPAQKGREVPVLFVDYLVGQGVDLFHAICERDLEGIVAKAAQGLYQPEKTTWVKIKNPNYSQAAGRRDFFDIRRKPATRFGKTPLPLGENAG